MKAPPLAEAISRLQKEIITTGMDKLRTSNIEKIKKLNELIEKQTQNEQIQDSNMGRN